MSELPEFASSPLAHARAAQAREGKLTLQQCRDCGEYQYPVRELCQYCLSGDLSWSIVTGSGTVIATARVHASQHAFFREHAPWPICSVKLQVGPRVIAHARDGAIESGVRVEVSDERVGPTHCVLVARIKDRSSSPPESA